MAVQELSIAITGAGGAGVISVGELLLRSWAAAGGRGLLRKAFGPQIRGGEAAALLKLCDHEQYTAAEGYDLLLAVDWNNFSRFGDEIVLKPRATVICQDSAGLPQGLLADQLRVIEIPIDELARSAHPGGRANMLALGMLAGLLGLERSPVRERAVARLAGKAEAYREAATACIDAGFEAAPAIELPTPRCVDSPGWYLSGNQGAGYGVLRAGVRFVAAYPITPASDALEYLAAPLEQLGGALVQAEDELAAINMVIGGAYGGVPSFTATSGPGLALMTESIGLAVASETPVTILNVMRGGPSTGIPTKSEQSDLNIALHGLHGDAPHLVLAPLSVADCVFTASWAVKLAQRLQTAAIILSDQFIGQSTAIVSRPREAAALPPLEAVAAGEDYLRYALTESGLSPLAAPGEADHRFTADGLEHNERGTPSASAADHQAQLDKRARKLELLDPGADWGEVIGDGSVGLLCFGSASAAVALAAQQLTEAGTSCRAISLRLLAPLPVAALAEALDGCERLFVVEHNHGGQLLRYLRGELALAGAVHGLALPGPVPLTARRIRHEIEEILSHE
ncbi:MAG: 2-oxoacid:acceptor oxidoreductase subunit alpha [Halieaceae bacterium]|jgi:2-oxoglutarate ferredoxin oxidoreductase subunit alpha|nr:2-oxoacid:acceptor oxidoreductase subunit alpha [Halieaceae bacterium]